MIIDKIENRNFYTLPEALAEALEYMAKAPLAEMEPGEYHLPGGQLMEIDEYTPSAGWKNFEGHNYITHLRYIVNGSEQLGYANKNDVEYVETKKADKMMYRGKESRVRVTAGSFVILFPQDCHVLKLADEDGILVRKVSVSIVSGKED